LKEKKLLLLEEVYCWKTSIAYVVESKWHGDNNSFKNIKFE